MSGAGPRQDLQPNQDILPSHPSINSHINCPATYYVKRVNMSDIQNPSVKTEDTDDPAPSSSAPNVKVKATPRKRKAAKKEEANDGGDVEEGPTKKPKAAPKAGIPDRYEDLAAEDKMLLKMKEEGKGGKEIAEAWQTMTGNKHTSLGTRYVRIKAAIARVKDSDLEALERAMEKAKERIEEEKKVLEKRLWAFVAEGMETEGAEEKYDVPTLEKAWKRLQAEGKNGGS
ncbi:hypothetical protein FKW77_007863 [Venturia effusa]|uniref:Uncharacterized protein n=1 Tax=Venturia effusa TaxID=50376 RepID=A0A517L5X8_9PEZI|nr:hypothetical protein FKW77_007863 [Venturia effusa]